MARRKGLLKTWAWALKAQVLAVWFAARDPAAPVPLRLLALAVAAYALSPIDLIPDFIPILGYLDDLVIVPLGLWLIVRYMPAPVMARARLRAEAVLQKPRSWIAAALFIAIWLLLAALLTTWLLRTFPAH